MHICLHKLCNSPLRSSHVRSHLTVNTTVNLKWTMRLSQCLLSHLYYSKLHKLLYQDRSLLSNVMILFTPPVEWASEWMFVCVWIICCAWLWSDPSCLALFLSLGRYSPPPHVSSRLSSERFLCSCLFFPELENAKSVCAWPPSSWEGKYSTVFGCCSSFKL